MLRKDACPKLRGVGRDVARGDGTWMTNQSSRIFRAAGAEALDDTRGDTPEGGCCRALETDVACSLPYIQVVKMESRVRQTLGWCPNILSDPILR